MVRLQLSFIDRVKAGGAKAMLGKFSMTGSTFDRTLTDLTVTGISEGAVTCELPVTKGLTNAYGTLHGVGCCWLLCCREFSLKLVLCRHRLCVCVG